MTRIARPASRRAILRGVGAGVGVVALAAIVAPPALLGAGPTDREPRYWFRCWGPGFLNGDYSSVEEVWAAPGYIELERIEVRYTRAGPFTLTPRERTAVDAVERSIGRSFTDPPGQMLKALRLSTRTPPARLVQEVRAAGTPAARLALQLHPEAPQAPLVAEVLDS